MNKALVFHLSLGLWMGVGEILCAENTAVAPASPAVVEVSQVKGASEMPVVESEALPAVQEKMIAKAAVEVLPSLADLKPIASVRFSAPERILSREGLFNALGIAPIAARAFISALALPLVGILDLNYDVVIHYYTQNDHTPGFFAVLRPISDPARIQILRDILKESGFSKFFEHEGFFIVTGSTTQLEQISQDKKLLAAVVQENTPWGVSKSAADRCYIQMDELDFAALRDWVERLLLKDTSKTPEKEEETSELTETEALLVQKEEDKASAEKTADQPAQLAIDVSAVIKSTTEDDPSQKKIMELVDAVVAELRHVRLVVAFDSEGIDVTFSAETVDPFTKLSKKTVVLPSIYLPENSTKAGACTSRDCKDLFAKNLRKIADKVVTILMKTEIVEKKEGQSKNKETQALANSPVSDGSSSVSTPPQKNLLPDDWKRKVVEFTEFLVSKLSDGSAGITGTLKNGTVISAGCYRFPGIKTLAELLSVKTSMLGILHPYRVPAFPVEKWEFSRYLRPEGTHDEVPLYGVGAEIFKVATALLNGENPPETLTQEEVISHLAYLNEELIVASTLDVLKQQIDNKQNGTAKKPSAIPNNFLGDDEIYKIDGDALVGFTLFLAQLGLRDYVDPTVTSAPRRASIKIHEHEVISESFFSYKLISWVFHFIMWAIEQESVMGPADKLPAGTKVPVKQPAKSNFVPRNVARQILIPVKTTTEYVITSKQKV
ncbi:MAG: hypothetical protein LW808_003465 [Verrucomicrobiota bacterium]|nr:MAG: hypothetical protein LW808_003465 [Verrucomicrobiota bacterium]